MCGFCGHLSGAVVHHVPFIQHGVAKPSEKMWLNTGSKLVLLYVGSGGDHPTDMHSNRVAATGMTSLRWQPFCDIPIIWSGQDQLDIGGGGGWGARIADPRLPPSKPHVPREKLELLDWNVIELQSGLGEIPSMHDGMWVVCGMWVVSSQWPSSHPNPIWLGWSFSPCPFFPNRQPRTLHYASSYSTKPLHLSLFFNQTKSSEMGQWHIQNTVQNVRYSCCVGCDDFNWQLCLSLDSFC